jgi:hypothetical protein
MITFTTCPTARSNSTTRSLDGEDTATERSSSTTGRAARAHSEFSRYPREPTGAQPAIDLRPQLRQVALLACRGQPHMPLDIIVTVSRGGHDLPQHLRRKIAHDLAEIHPLTTASARHPAILAPPPERRAPRPQLRLKNWTLRSGSRLHQGVV